MNPVVSHKASIVSSQGAEQAQTIKILHVEDNYAVAVMIKETLETEGCEVDTCGNGETAMEKIASSDNYDLLLLDNDLPRLDGLEIVRRTRRMPHRCRVPIIMLSATREAKAAALAGADLCLLKPEDIPLVAETIRRLLTPR